MTVARFHRVPILQVAAIIGALAALLYLPTLKFRFTNLDDVNLILGQTRFLREPSSFVAVFARTYFPSPSSVYYRPFVSLSIVANYHLGHENPAGYHLMNCLLHGLVSALVFIFLYRVTARFWPAFLGSLFFAAHPAQVASVAWIPGRNDLLLGAFTVASLLFLIRDCDGPRRFRIVAHFACFGGALLCKETAVCLPLVYATWLNVLRSSRPWRSLVFGWSILLLAYFVVRASVVPHLVLADRLLVSGLEVRVFLAEIGKLSGLSTLQVVAAPDDVRLGWATIVVLGFCAASLLVRGTSRAKVTAALVLVILPLLMSLPASKTIVLENWLYLPAMGAALLVSILLARFENRRPVRWVVRVLVLVLVLGFGLRTVRYSECFANPERFSEAALQGSPNSATARHLRFRSFYRHLGALNAESP